MLTHQSATSAINLVDEENEQAPWFVEAEALPGNAMDDVVMSVIARVEQTLGASAPRINIGMSAPRGCSSPHNMIDGVP